MRVKLGLVGTVGAIVAAAVAWSSAALAQNAVVLKGVTPWQASYYWSEPFLIFQRLVNTRLKGKVQVDYLGGPEVVPPNNQFEAVRNGTIDTILAGASYYAGEIPESMAGTFSKKAGSALRQTGYFDLMRRIHLEKGNVVYLASIGGEADRAFRFFIKKKIDKPDFTGLKLRVSPIYVDMVKALGGTPVNIAPGEVYTALERGVIDGVAWSYGGIADFGWQDQVKFVVEQAFYTGGSSILINKAAWDKLAPEVRAELEKIGAELEVESEKFHAGFAKREDAMLKGLGLEFVKFDAGDTRKYLAAAYDQAWKAFVEKNPKYGPDLMKSAQ
jgi:TRAP-type C4-dicarboxylate transport system substrate-binding protein